MSLGRSSARLSSRSLRQSGLLGSLQKKKSTLDDAQYFEKKLEVCQAENRILEDRARLLEAELERTSEEVLRLHESNLAEKDKLEKELRRIKAIEKNKRLSEDYYSELKGLVAAQSTSSLGLELP